MKYLLDTNVYLEAVRSEESRARFRRAFFPLLPATFLSAVVAYELNVDARDRRTRSLIRDFIRPLERTGRLVSPGFGDWVDASATTGRTSGRSVVTATSRSRPGMIVRGGRVAGVLARGVPLV